MKPGHLKEETRRFAAGTLMSALVAVAGIARGDGTEARVLAANCTSCHGPLGVSAGAIPSIAGLEKSYIAAALQEFKAGTRQATVMHQHAKGYTDSEIAALAGYFSQQQRP
ncbi:MAG: hypothetical protein C5B46_01950 [Proteobacteria bacterium]|nr:MAG: hypothetical protein C5B46_01950 [Pseudomonadota bacterium]